MPRQRRRSNKKAQGCGTMWGGAGAADHAIAVYGGIGQQVAQAGGNIIHENPVGPEVMHGGAALAPAQYGGEPHLPVQHGGAALAPAQYGGNQHLPVQHGGLTPAELGVPAVLLAATQLSRRRRRSSKKRRGSRRRRSNRRR